MPLIKREKRMKIGVYQAAINRGRFHIPAVFRKSFGMDCLLMNGFEPCVYLFSLEEWHVFAENLVERNKDDRRLKNFLRGATQCHIDAKGRVTIPENQRSHADIKSQGAIALVGCGDHIAIYDAEYYHEMMNSQETKDAQAEIIAELWKHCEDSENADLRKR
jgi:MraZ protein